MESHPSLFFSPHGINAIERGRYMPSLQLASKFARVFNCPADEFSRLVDGKLPVCSMPLNAGRFLQAGQRDDRFYFSGAIASTTAIKSCS